MVQGVFLQENTDVLFLHFFRFCSTCLFKLDSNGVPFSEWSASPIVVDSLLL